MNGNRTRATKDGAVSQFNARGWLRAERDRNGNQTGYAYDGNGRHLITDPTGQVPMCRCGLAALHIRVSKQLTAGANDQSHHAGVGSSEGRRSERDRIAECSPRILFRVEILRAWRSRGKYRARVYRKESFRIQPTFPQQAGKPQYEQSDEGFFVEDVSGAWDTLNGKTVKEVFEKVLQKIRETFRQEKK